jgi:hypothetical protein
MSRCDACFLASLLSPPSTQEGHRLAAICDAFRRNHLSAERLLAQAIKRPPPNLTEFP